MQEPDSKSYIQRAFWSQYNLIGLGGALAFSVALASFTPLLIALVLEIAWLLIAPRSESFRRSSESDGARAGVPVEDSAALSALRNLEPQYAARHSSLAQQAYEIRALAEARGGYPVSDWQPAWTQLELLRGSFLRMCEIHQRVSRFLSGTPSQDLELEVAELGRSMSAEKDLGVRLTIRHALAVAQRRLAQREQMASTQRAVEIELQTVEKSFAYLRSQAMGLATPQDLLREAEALTAQVASISALDASTQDAGSATSQRTFGSVAQRLDTP